MNSRTWLGGAEASGTGCDIFVEDCGELGVLEAFSLRLMEDIIAFMAEVRGIERGGVVRM
jgi:hypothetical protein